MAVRTANPFLVSLVAVADHFIYANRAICYSFGQGYIRILLLRGRVTEELEINVLQLLLSTDIPDVRKRGAYKFKPIHYSDGILSCLYTRTKNGVSANWLVVLGTEPPRVLKVHPLTSTIGIFVRNNKRYLYYGTKSEYSADRYKRWVIWGLDLQTGIWTAQRLILCDFVGAEMGSTICFEIFDGYFYGLSSQTMFEPAEDKWNSFYYAFRFLLGHHITTQQVLPRPASWRRQATEGPIDDRWSVLELSKDEKSGKVFVFESRKEWLPINSQGQRTCYRKELVFPQLETEGIHGLRGPTGMVPPRDPVGWESEKYYEIRRPEDLHVGDNGSSGTTFTLHDSLINSYNTSCRSFVDLVNQPSALSPATQRLRLRIRPQLPDPSPPVNQGGKPAAQPADSSGGGRSPSDHEINFWPPDQDPERPDPLLDHLYWLLNPQGPAEEVQWGADERFIVYSPKTSTKGQLRAVILISFDPSLHLHGLQKLRGGSAGDFHVEAVQPRKLSSFEDISEKDVGCSPKPVLPVPSEVVPSQETGVKPHARGVATGADSRSPSWACMKSAFYISIEGSGRGPCGFDFTR